MTALNPVLRAMNEENRNKLYVCDICNKLVKGSGIYVHKYMVHHKVQTHDEFLHVLDEHPGLRGVEYGEMLGWNVNKTRRVVKSLLKHQLIKRVTPSDERAHVLRSFLFPASHQIDADTLQSLTGKKEEKVSATTTKTNKQKKKINKQTQTKDDVITIKAIRSAGGHIYAVIDGELVKIK